VTEEAQHTLMFQEFVDRSGLPVAGLPAPSKRVAEIGVLPPPTRPLWQLFGTWDPSAGAAGAPGSAPVPTPNPHRHLIDP
jgi:hypothetical protein